MVKACGKIASDIRSFIELSLREEEGTWEEWCAAIVRPSDVRCWEKKRCSKTGCPAYEGPDGRCWLVAGTMCGGEPQGEFAVKYRSCTECDVYRDAVYDDPVVEIYEHIVTLVHNLRSKHDRLRVLATRDTLTGLYNRNYFDDIIGRESERARRYGERHSLMLIDIDGFKTINDTYGHLHGDGVLREFAAILQRATRASDILCRFGGDEFVILSPRVDCEGGDAIPERIQIRLDEWNEEYASRDYLLSCSIGCATLDGSAEIETVLDLADRRMFREKNGKKA
jgi:diguanylate cyclase (GGDEF)-like protein